MSSESLVVDRAKLYNGALLDDILPKSRALSLSTHTTSIPHSTMTSLPSFPTEVFEAVIDQARNDTASLRQISLTCSTFLPRARYQLFDSICIRSVQQLALSHKFLDSHPWVSQLVRNVTLSISLPDDYSGPNIPLLDVVPIHLLSRFPNLRAWRMEVAGNEVDRMPPAASLSFHRSAITCYRKYGAPIQTLVLSRVRFESLSHFRALVSALTGLRDLTCSNVQFRTVAPHNPLQQVRSLALRSLNISTSDIAIHVLDYLLSSSAATLKNLSVAVAGANADDYFHSLKTLISRLSQLSLLTLAISYGDMDSVDVWGDDDDVDWNASKCVNRATRILEPISTTSRSGRRSLAEGVSVEFNLDSIARSDTAIMTGKALYEALTVFHPRCRVLDHESVGSRGVGNGGSASVLVRWFRHH